MLASQRRSVILELVEESGAVKVSDLVERLGVSDMTIRRDIERLSTDGLLERVHGGALALGDTRSSEEPGFTAKSLLQRAQKQAIARAAAQRVEVGSAIGISAGTTTSAYAVRSAEGCTTSAVTPRSCSARWIACAAVRASSSELGMHGPSAAQIAW